MSSSALLHSPRRSGSETMSLDNVLNPPTSDSYNVPWEGQHPWTPTANGAGYNDYHTASHSYDAMSYHAHAHAPQPLPPPRLDHQHYSPYRYPQPHPQPAMYSPPIDDYSEYPHDNYDMLSQRSQGHGYPDPPVPQHSVEPSLADINHLQNAERASTRIFVRQSFGVAPVPRYLDRYDDDVDFPYASSSGSHKRPASNVEALQPPKPKKQKKRATDSGPQPSTSKRGFNSKKRGEVAQVNRENERVVNGKGKGRAIDDNLPPAQLGAPLTPERQAARCMSAKYRSDKISRCLSCTRRWAGDTCRFQGVRIFYRAPDGSVDFVSFTQNPMDTVKPVTFPTKWNVPFSEEHRKITQIMAARTLLPVLEAEQRHVQHSDETVFRSRETDCRASCDTCMTSTFSETWMCRTCGREACKDCFARVASLTMMKPGITRDEAARSLAQREKLNELNPSFLSCLKRTDHDANSFVRVTRFSPDELTRAIGDMRKVLEEEESESNSSLEGTPELSHMAPSSSTDSSGIRTPVDSVGSSGIPTASTSPFTPSPVESIKDNFPYPDVPSHQIHRFETVDDISRAQFTELWRAGEPIVIGGMLDRLKINWTPEYFIQHHGDTSVRLLECQANFDSGRMTVAEFFKLFGQYEGRKPDVLKLRDWPPTSDFKTMFPDLFEDFSQAVPFPDYVRRDGVSNMSSHFPVDVLAPDVGPKMYNAMATTTGKGSQGSTRLHMDMADALNIMTYASPCPDGSEGCAAWDLFRREDSETVRAFLKETFGFGKTETSRRHGPDPIHSQLFYLTDELLQQLYERHGVKSFRFYQKPGEAVMIPAGCAHQVANLADSIKVAIDYVSPENITACETLTREFRSQNVRSAWKDDVLQLRSMMWYAWQSCQRTDMEKDTA